MAPGQLSSAKPFLALLQETDHELIEFALKNLETQIDQYWFEMASSVPLIIEVSESESFLAEVKQRASLVASQIYFHMGKLSESVKFALSAGSLLDVTRRTEYTDTIVGACVDLYVSLREKEAERALMEDEGMDQRTASELAGPGGNNNNNNNNNNNSEARGGSMQRYASTTASSYEPSPEVDARVAAVFERLATTWQDNSIASAKEMIGFCLRARRCDLLTALLRRVAVASAQNGPSLLTHAFQVSMAHVRDMRFRKEAVRAIADLYADLAANKLSEVFQHAQCLVFLEDTDAIAKLIYDLLKNNNTVYALQLAFDISESSNQDLVQRIIGALQTISAPPGSVSQDGEATTNNNDDDNAGNNQQQQQQANSRVKDITAILSGSYSTDLYLKFLFSRCKADQPMFQKMKKLIPAKASVLVSAVMTSGCLSYSGTAHDSFLRDNIAILARLSDWSRYTAAASLGVVHRGHTDEIMNLLKPYLPNRGSVSPLPFQEAGALYALGLAMCGNTIEKKKDADAVKYLKDALTDFAASEQLVHGASMGLGLAAMGLQDQSISDQLFTSVTSGEAVASEGAALAIGLVQLASANDYQCEVLLNAAREQHQKEKTIRGLVMSIALMLMRRESLALPLVEDMSKDRDPWIRVGACYVLGLAYAATDSTLAIEKLLKLCVEDPHDEVRRASIMMIGFVCLNNLEHCVAMVRPFTDNYSAHVRYGVAMALAVASAGVPDAAVLRLLRRLGDDAVPFVRQGSLIAQSLVLIQATEQQTSYVKEFRAKIWKLISDQRMDSCTKFGAILAAGLIDAGGRNCTIALHRNGTALLRPIVGMFLFSQYWHWFPHVLPICLALQPTCVIGLNENLAMPQLSMISNAPPDQFAPPPTMLEEKSKDPKAGKVELAKLSATTIEEQRKAEKKKLGAGSKVDADSARPSQTTTTTTKKNQDGTDAAVGDGDGENNNNKEQQQPKATTETLQNPARVTKAQLAVLEVEQQKEGENQQQQRYTPLREKLSLGVNMLIDRKPEEGEDKQIFRVDFSQRSDDVKPPEPFAWP